MSQEIIVGYLHVMVDIIVVEKATSPIHAHISLG
jgi:hypothetical protein